MKQPISTLRKWMTFVSFCVALFLTAATAKSSGILASTAVGIAAFAFLTTCMHAPQPTLYANAFGALNDTPILHDFFVEFWADLLPISDFVLDTQDPIGGSRAAKPGDTIQIKNWKQDFTVYTVGGSGYNTPTDIAPTTTPFVLPSVAKAVSFTLTAPEFRLLASGRNKGADYDAFKKRVTNGALYKLGATIIGDMLAVVTAANFPNNTVSAAGTFSRAKETVIEQAFYDRNVPLENPQILLPSTTYREWVDDHQAIVNYTNAPVQKPLLFSGKKQGAATPFVFNRTGVAMPAESARGFAATRTAIIGAIRVPEETTWQGDPVSLAEIVDPRTGAAFLARMWKNAQTGALQMDFASIWNFQVGQREALQRITAA